MAKPVAHSGAPWLLIGGGISALAGAWFARSKSEDTTSNIQKALHSGGVGGGTPLAPNDGSDAARGIVTLKLTCYWPFTASDAEKKMEGAPVDRKSQPLHTVEDFFAGKSDFVSLAGDYEVWPYGQRINIPWGDGRTIVGRVVDTGGHFHGSNKLYRVLGAEPIDVCVYDRNTKPVKSTVQAQIISGDNYAKGAAVATGGLKGQNVVAGEDIVEGRITEDYDALARAVESELGGHSREEMIAGAWAIRNRAAFIGQSVYQTLCPTGEYGSPQKSGGYCSTRRVPTDAAHSVADEVLGAPDSADPTGGAVDFWMPQQQDKLHQLGDIYRAARHSGDDELAQKYERYADYGDEGEVRTQFARNGLHVTKIVGAIELLGKV